MLFWWLLTNFHVKACNGGWGGGWRSPKHCQLIHKWIKRMVFQENKRLVRYAWECFVITLCGWCKRGHSQVSLSGGRSEWGSNISRLMNVVPPNGKCSSSFTNFSIISRAFLWKGDITVSGTQWGRYSAQSKCSLAVFPHRHQTHFHCIPQAGKPDTWPHDLTRSAFSDMVWSYCMVHCCPDLAVWGKSEIDRMTAIFFFRATIKRLTLILNLSQVVSSRRTCWELSQCQLEQWQKWLSHLTVINRALSPATSQSAFYWCLCFDYVIRHHQVSPVHVFRGHNFTTRWFCFARLSLRNKQALRTCSVASSIAGTKRVLRKRG